MNYIVLDLEWNQSSHPEGEIKEIPFEIIEIGAVKLNGKKEMIGEFSELIHPHIYKEMHKITRKLIHLQMEELEKGDEFTSVARRFLNWCGDDVTFCTWGPLDLTELQRNMVYYGMDALAYAPLPFLDVQKLFSIAYEDRKSRRSLEYAIDFLHIEKDIPFHRAFSDAYYTAKVLALLPAEIEKNVSFDLFHKPSTRKEEVHIVFDDYAKYISRKFADKQEAFKDREVCSTKCYYCHRNIKRKMRWFTPNGKHYYSISYCDKHGYMKGKIRIRKATEDDSVYVVKTLKFIPEEEIQKIKELQEKARMLRKQKRIRAKSS